MVPKEIHSLQHPIVKTFVKLRTQRKSRYEENKVVLSGLKQISEAKKVLTLLLKEGTTPPCQADEIYFVTEAILKKVTGLENPEPVAAMVPLPAWSTLKGKNKLLALDGVSDPGNLGTLIRTACALGWEGVFLTEHCVDPFNDKALRAAKGATFTLPLREGTVENLLQLVEEEQLTPWIGDIEGTPLPEVKKERKILLILGNEAHGVSGELKKQFPKVTIPFSGIESLNVAAAGAILMYSL